MGLSTLSLKLLALPGAILQFSQGIVQLLLAVVELPLHLAHLPLDLRLAGGISEDLLQLISNGHDLREQRPLVIQILGNPCKCLQLLFSICLVNRNVIQIIADLGEIV